MNMPIRSRFYTHVRVTAGDGCWNWTGGTSNGGYGAFSVGGRQGGMRGAHRVSWELEHGPIPEGMFVMHRCDNPRCVRPSHLELGSRDENMRDMAVKERARTTRLTADQVIEIHRAARAGTGHSDIAGQFGISKSNVSMIVTGRTWKHIFRDLIVLLGGEA